MASGGTQSGKMDFVVQPETGQRTVKCMERDHTGVWVPADDSSIIADTAVGVAVAMTALTPRPPGTWLLHQYRTGNRSAHPSASAHEVTSLRPEEVSFGRTEASRRLNLSFHELCPLPRHTPHPRIPRWYF